MLELPKKGAGMEKKMIYAAGYYPMMHDREDWENDLKSMKEAGINVVRTAELFNGWDQIEPVRGQFEFGFLDDFFDRCKDYGIKILLGTGTASPPYWVHERYLDVNIVNNHGESYPNNVSYGWACVDHPGYLEEVERYLRVLVSRYQHHEALFAYQIHNEISLPFMPLNREEIDLYCYCSHSEAKFRSWVKKKYVTLDALNYAYRWGATNTRHTKWSQVIPPRTKPESWSSITRWMDWRLYWMENLVSFVGLQNRIIKEMDREHLTTTNIFFLKSQDPLGVLTALDQFSMAEQVDIIGYDLYPGSGDKLEKFPEFSSMFLDMARSTALPMKKPFWLLETESGPINGWVLGPSRNVRGSDLIRNVFEAAGHGAKAILYQGWREWDFQPIHWGGIMDLDDEKTERYASAAVIGKALENEGKALQESLVPESKVAILLSKENAIIINGMGQEQFLLKSLRGAYRYFWERDYPVDFITPELLLSGEAKKYPLLYLPFSSYITLEMADALSSYVRDGGCLVGTARCGMLGEHGWYNHKIPCFTLGKTFGVEAIEVEAKVNPEISIGRKTFSGHWHREKLSLLSDKTEILGRYADDTPAVTLNHFGEGMAIYFGTHPEVAYLEEGSLLLDTVMDRVMGDLGLRPLVELDYAGQKVKEIDAHLLMGNQMDYLILTAYVPRQHTGFYPQGKKKIRVCIRTEASYLQMKDVLTDVNYDFTEEKGKTSLELTVMEKETKLIRLAKGKEHQHGEQA